MKKACQSACPRERSMAVLAEFSIYPLETEHTSKVVAKVIETLKSAGLRCQFRPMGIEVEGTWEQMQEAIRRCHQLVALQENNLPKFFGRGPRAPDAG
jgi:uncharacterized protein YqgV (UPF0045/DUF77 family)